MKSPYPNERSSFRPPPTTTRPPHSTFMNSNVTFNPLARPTTSTATSVVSSHGSNNSSTSTVPINIKFCDPKAMLAYCDHHNKEFSSVRFTVDGHRVKAEMTPDDMGMEDGDEVDTWVDMEGGSCMISLQFNRKGTLGWMA